MDRATAAVVVFFSASVAGMAADATFQDSVQPLFANNCYRCHNAKLKSGDLNLQAYTSASALIQDREKAEAILRKLQTGEMPPKGLPRPDAVALKTVTAWIQTEFNRADNSPEPGRVTARRLNRSEYNNTIRDLLDVDFHATDDFPQDDSGYGFDDIGDALSVSPVLMERYLAAAEKVIQTALFGPGAIQPTVVRHQPPYRPGTDGGDNSRFAKSLPYTITDYDLTGLTLPSALHAIHHFPATGEYVFRIDPEGNRPRPSDPFTVAVWIDGKQVATAPFESTNAPTSLEGQDKTVRITVPAGDHWVAVSALRLYEGLPKKYGGLKPNFEPEPPPPDFSSFFKPKPDATPQEIAELEARRKTFQARRGPKPPLITDVSFRINFIEITGPYNAETAPSAKSLTRIFTCGRLDRDHTPGCVGRIMHDLARRAYRRPPTPQETSQLVALVTQDQRRGDSFEQAIGVGIEAILVSPQFLFRIERDPKPKGADPEHLVSEYELASRLSYFLWSSMPDDELLQCATAEPCVIRRCSKCRFSACFGIQRRLRWSMISGANGSDSALSNRSIPM